MEKKPDTTATEATPKTTATPRTRGKRTTTPATTTSEAYLKTAMAVLDCNDPAQLAEKAQYLQGQVQGLQKELAVKGNELSLARGEARGYFNDSFKALQNTHWPCDKPSDLSGRISGLVAGYKTVLGDAAYFQNFVLKTCALLGTEDPKLIEEKLKLIISRKDELDNLTRTAQLCLLPQWRPAKRENLAEAVTNLCDSWSANVDRIRDMDQKNTDLNRECEALTKDVARQRKAADGLADELKDTIQAMQRASDEAERLRPVLPFWARALAHAVWTATVFALAHKMGFEAHAIIGGGK